MSIDNNSYDLEESRSHSETDATAESGDGGGTLDLWQQLRPDLLKDVAGATFENNSSFEIPPGIINNGYDRGGPGEERFHGVAGKAKVLSAAGLPVSGTATIEQSGQVVASAAGAGGVSVTAPPLGGVVSGDPALSGSYDFRFKPSLAGADVFEEGIGTGYDAGIIQYGAVEGTVTDYDGDLLEGEPVLAPGIATKTGPSGEYNLKAPGGVEINFRAAGETVSRAPAAGSTLTVDFQFARLEIEVVTPELDPVVGAEVAVGSKSFTTNEQGRVVVDPAPVAEYQIVVAGEYARTTEIQQQGERRVERFGDDQDKAGVNLLLVDDKTGQPIRALPGEVPGGAVAQSDTSGRLKLFVDDVTGVDRLRIGDGDDRYRTVEFSDFELRAGEVAEGKLRLERKTQVSNT
jgi:hypothetical protein